MRLLSLITAICLLTQQFAAASTATKTVTGAAISAGAQSAIYGDNLGEAFTDRLKSGAINAVGAELAGEIGQAYKQGEIDKATQLIAHAALGCGIGAASSDNCAAGAAGGVAGEIAGEAYLKHKLKQGITLEDIPEIEAKGTNLGQLAGAMAAALSGADGEGVYEGAGAGANAAQNNALDTIFDGLMVLADSGKIAYGYYINDEGMVEEGFVDLAADSAAFMIPFVPAGSSKVARALGKGAEKAGVKLWEPKEVAGRKVYQRDDLIDPNRVDDKTGLTNIELMNKGNAPIGKDGQPIELHHMTQQENIGFAGNKGSVAEVEASFHGSTPNKTILHTNVKDKNYPDMNPGIDKSSFRQDKTQNAEFTKYRKDYWENRAKDFK